MRRRTVGWLGLAALTTMATSGCALLERGGEGGGPPLATPTTEPDPWTEFLVPVNRYCVAGFATLDGRSFTTAEVAQEWLDTYAGVLDGIVFSLGSQPPPPGQEATVQELMAKTADVAGLLRGLLGSNTPSQVVETQLFALQTSYDAHGLAGCELP